MSESRNGQLSDGSMTDPRESQDSAMAPPVRPVRTGMTPDLAVVVDAWPALPEAMKVCILAMVKAASK